MNDEKHQVSLLMKKFKWHYKHTKQMLYKHLHLFILLEKNEELSQSSKSKYFINIVFLVKTSPLFPQVIVMNKELMITICIPRRKANQFSI